MSNDTWKLGAIVAVAMAIAAACNHKAPEAEIEVANSEPVANETTRAPLVLKLRGPDPVPTNGDILLDLDIVVREPLSLPVTLKLTPPAGATLVSGNATESIAFTQTGTFKRRFVVHTNAALASPVVVTAESVAPDNSFGLRARRQYPAAPKAAVPANQRPPVVRPGMAPPVSRH